MSGTSQRGRILYQRRQREENVENDMPASTRRRDVVSSAPSAQQTPSTPIPSPRLGSSYGDNEDTSPPTPAIPHSGGVSDVVSMGSETQAGSTRPILTLTREGFLPSHDAAVAITGLFKGHYIEPWQSWTKIPEDLRTAWFNTFLGKFTIDPTREELARKNFEKRGAALLKNLLEKVRKKGQRPDWLGEDVWDGLCSHWQSDLFKKASSVAKANRASGSGGNAGPTHIGGSISASQHRLNMEKETGVAPSPIDVFRKTHQRNDQSWANNRSEELMKKFNEEMAQRTEAATASGDPAPAQLDVWRDVAGVKKGRVYGLGSESMTFAPTPRCLGSSSTSTDLMQEIEHLRTENTQLKDRLALNEDQLAKTKEKMENMDMTMQQVVEYLKSHPNGPTPRFSSEQPDIHGDDAGEDNDETETPDDYMP